MAPQPVRPPIHCTAAVRAIGPSRYPWSPSFTHLRTKRSYPL
jgi:hypothetical protein